MLSTEESKWRVYVCSFHYSWKFAVGLKVLKIKNLGEKIIIESN